MLQGKELEDMARNMAARRLQSVADVRSVDWEALLTPTQALRLEQARQRASLRHLDGRFLVDLHSNLQEPSTDLRCLVGHGLLWSEKLKRPACAAEHLLAQGVCVVKGLGSALAPWAHSSFRLSEDHLKKLAGRGMHAMVVGTLLAYTLATTVHVFVAPCRSLAGSDGCGLGVWTAHTTTMLRMAS